MWAHFWPLAWQSGCRCYFEIIIATSLVITIKKWLQCNFSPHRFHWIKWSVVRQIIRSPKRETWTCSRATFLKKKLSIKITTCWLLLWVWHWTWQKHFIQEEIRELLGWLAVHVTMISRTISSLPETPPLATPLRGDWISVTSWGWNPGRFFTRLWVHGDSVDSALIKAPYMKPMLGLKTKGC